MASHKLVRTRLRQSAKRLMFLAAYRGHLRDSLGRVPQMVATGEVIVPLLGNTTPQAGLKSMYPSRATYKLTSAIPPQTPPSTLLGTNSSTAQTATTHCCATYDAYFRRESGVFPHMDVVPINRK